jgi:hypothetical protein
MFGQRACDLLREVAVASADALPAYNVRCRMGCTALFVKADAGF